GSRVTGENVLPTDVAGLPFLVIDAKARTGDGVVLDPIFALRPFDVDAAFEAVTVVETNRSIFCRVVILDAGVVLAVHFECKGSLAVRQTAVLDCRILPINVNPTAQIGSRAAENLGVDRL